VKRQCDVLTKKGNLCPINADRCRDGVWYCHVHDPHGTCRKQHGAAGSPVRRLSNEPLLGPALQFGSRQKPLSGPTIKEGPDFIRDNRPVPPPPVYPTHEAAVLHCPFVSDNLHNLQRKP
jgi:hypothetical protein